MVTEPPVPSRDDTLQVVKRLEKLTDEVKRLRDRVTELARSESEAQHRRRENHTRRHDEAVNSEGAATNRRTR